jgi:mono/diheme cytochrome c family protein
MDEMPVDAPSVRAATDIEAGRYLVTIGGCNDCHTNGYMQTEGAVPEGDWLLGSPVGWRGPWGTPYAPNLRLTAQSMTEDEWVTMLKTRNALPPMPWMNVNKFHERDARAIYRYISSLEPSGEMMPAALPPGQEPTTPFLLMEPQNLPTADNR